VASLISHAVVSISVGTCFYGVRAPTRVWVAGVVCSMLPDVDVLGFRFGVRYGDFWGHRGFTHSLLFAAVLATLTLILGFTRGLPGISRLSLWTYFFIVTASHGLLDAMTNGGLGVAFFSPFDDKRYFLPWRPIRVSPIGLRHFFTDRGLAVIQSEFLWIWLPAGLLASLALIWHQRIQASNASSAE